MAMDTTDIQHLIDQRKAYLTENEVARSEAALLVRAAQPIQAVGHAGQAIEDVGQLVVEPCSAARSPSFTHPWQLRPEFSKRPTRISDAEVEEIIRASHGTIEEAESILDDCVLSLPAHFSQPFFRRVGEKLSLVHVVDAAGKLWDIRAVCGCVAKKLRAISGSFRHKSVISEGEPNKLFMTFLLTLIAPVHRSDSVNGRENGKRSCRESLPLFEFKAISSDVSDPKPYKCSKRNKYERRHDCCRQLHLFPPSAGNKDGVPAGRRQVLIHLGEASQ